MERVVNDGAGLREERKGGRVRVGWVGLSWVGLGWGGLCGRIGRSRKG